MRRLPLPGLAALLVVGTATLAQADAADRAAADRLFRSGRAAAKRGDTKAACADFAESERLDPALGTVLNLAECEEKLGRLVSASRHLQQALGRLPATDQRRGPARSLLESISKRMPHVVVRLPSDSPRATTVARDGVELDPASLGTPEQVDPGEHVFVVRAPEHEDASFRLTVAEGEDRTLDVKVGGQRSASTPAVAMGTAPAQESRATAPDVADKGDAQRTVGLIVGGVGVIGLGVGVVAGVLALGHKSDRDASCGGTFPSCVDAATREAIVSSQESMKSAGTISTIGFAAGGVFVLAGAVLYLTADRRSTTATRVTPMVGASQLGLGLSRPW